jgi:TolB-like protein/class 3 adenylate cyclase/Tfp pilus assembly protein PilF
MSAEIKKEIQLEIAHVLFIDIVGYSRLSINQQRAIIDELTEVVRSSDQYQKAEAAERLIKIPTGDGMALVFYTSPEAPAQCALEISRALKEHPSLPLRMGVHSGPVSGVIDVNGQANLAGGGLNMAQRVMDCADAGHILVSKRAADDLGEYEQWRPLLHELGVCEVKHGVRVWIVNFCGDGVGNPQEPKTFRLLRRRRAQMRWAMLGAASLLLATIFGVVVFLRRPTSSTSTVPQKSIAVLPFENRSSDKENAYFAEGIQDEIITRLSKMADLKVISRTSTQLYKSEPENLPQIAMQLGVAHILEGSVQKSGDAVRVNVQLIKAATDSHLWAEIFDRKLTDVFLVESDVAKAIAEQLQAKLTGQEKEVIAAKPTDNPEAYDAYLRGLAYTFKIADAPANALGAQKHLREAVRLDPKFALSWALLSYVDATSYITMTLPPTDALREEARRAAETALALRPNLGEAVWAKGYYLYCCLKDYDAAVRYFEQARRLLPNNSRVIESLAYVARRQGKWERSESYFNEAERLDPRNVNVLTQHAHYYMAVRRFPEALRKLDEVLDVTPDDVDALALKATVAQMEGDLPRASALLAPLHPAAATNIGSLETQVYQAVLERRSAQVIPRLNEVLAEPASATDYHSGELRFWLAWAQEVAGDQAAARETWRQGRDELALFLKEQPENYNLIGYLALTNVGLGDKAAALTLAERAMKANPIEKDAVSGPASVELLARVTACTGEHERAIAALQKLLSIPYAGPMPGEPPITRAILRRDPMFDSLRNDPRFQKLCQE